MKGHVQVLCSLSKSLDLIPILHVAQPTTRISSLASQEQPTQTQKYQKLIVGAKAVLNGKCYPLTIESKAPSHSLLLFFSSFLLLFSSLHHIKNYRLSSQILDTTRSLLHLHSKSYSILTFSTSLLPVYRHLRSHYLIPIFFLHQSCI